MRCPFCSGQTRVLDSRPNEEDPEVRRRRKCYDCLESFTTYERVEKPEAAAKVEAAARKRLAGLKAGLKVTMKQIENLEESCGSSKPEGVARRID